MKKGTFLFTSESVTEGHPDKLCDKISDAVLDAVLEKDPNGRVAVECLIKTGFVILAGEITTKANIDFQKIAREAVRETGYNHTDTGFDSNTCAVLLSISEQSPHISSGVTEGTGLFTEQGAGDQGLMFGYACNETPELMPLPIALAHKITRALSEKRKKKEIDWILPDGKSQVTIKYENGKPKRLDTVVVSTHHKKGIPHSVIFQTIKEKIIQPICGEWMDEKTNIYVNPTGSFEVGGPIADSGLTGRKIIVDTYGGYAPHGGGAFSGKDPSKVDRSAAYMARYIAKNIVASQLAEKCEIQLAYAIGVAQPVSIYINTFETGKIPDEKISEIVSKLFPLTPKGIIETLQLQRPIYQKTASYGHFGRNEPEFTWEKTDKVNELKEEVDKIARWAGCPYNTILPHKEP
jgi:S-adenosylmethionine synthetase